MVVMLFAGHRRGIRRGLALGDALGTAVESKPPGGFPEVAGYRGGRPQPLT
jgi:ADP-ribosylglycohydrolase